MWKLFRFYFLTLYKRKIIYIANAFFLILFGVIVTLGPLLDLQKMSTMSVYYFPTFDISSFLVTILGIIHAIIVALLFSEQNENGMSLLLSVKPMKRITVILSRLFVIYLNIIILSILSIGILFLTYLFHGAFSYTNFLGTKWEFVTINILALPVAIVIISTFFVAIGLLLYSLNVSKTILLVVTISIGLLINIGYTIMPLLIGYNNALTNILKKSTRQRSYYLSYSDNGATYYYDQMYEQEFIDEANKNSVSNTIYSFLNIGQQFSDIIHWSNSNYIPSGYIISAPGSSSNVNYKVTNNSIINDPNANILSINISTNKQYYEMKMEIGWYEDAIRGNNVKDTFGYIDVPKVYAPYVYANELKFFSTPKEYEDIVIDFVNYSNANTLDGEKPDYKILIPTFLFLQNNYKRINNIELKDNDYNAKNKIILQFLYLWKQLNKYNITQKFFDKTKNEWVFMNNKKPTNLDIQEINIFNKTSFPLTNDFFIYDKKGNINIKFVPYSHLLTNNSKDDFTKFISYETSKIIPTQWVILFWSLFVSLLLVTDIIIISRKDYK